MTDVDAGGGTGWRLAVLAQYRMATTEQMHLVIAPGVRIEQTRRRLAKLRSEGLVDRVTLPRAGRTRVWLPTQHGVQVAGEWPELRGRRPPKTVADPTAVRLRVGHGLTVTETALAFLQDARHRSDLCRPLDWLPEVYHPLVNGEAVIPDALLYYRRASDSDWSMLRAFVEVDRATMGPERLAAKIGAYARLHAYAPVARRRLAVQEPPQEEWRQHYPLFPRVLFVLDGTGPAEIDTRIRALHAAARDLAPSGFTTSPSSRRRWSSCSGAAPRRAYGAPSTIRTNESAGAPGIGRSPALVCATPRTQTRPWTCCGLVFERQRRLPRVLDPPSRPRTRRPLYVPDQAEYDLTT
ncbi:replication-relaxation family protein [Streptomyces sp. NBC_01352]|uniref:replication-relaxation family protein n=1 Tax=Streptomyces sp. NBC_01352 TaxID=2903834 RepID=UPI002E315E71|nr:replication-relaxation family protein [Streptomyces sp. NBC_01352]